MRPLTVPVFTGRKMWGNAPGPAWRTPLQGRHSACPNDPIKVPSHLSYCPVKTSPACHTPREGYAPLSVSVLVFSISRFLNNNFAPSPLVPGRRGAGQEETAGDRDVAGGNDG